MHPLTYHPYILHPFYMLTLSYILHSICEYLCLISLFSSIGYAPTICRIVPIDEQPLLYFSFSLIVLSHEIAFRYKKHKIILQFKEEYGCFIVTFLFSFCFQLQSKNITREFCNWQTNIEKKIYSTIRMLCYIGFAL